jgi:hypothetical protein
VATSTVSYRVEPIVTVSSTSVFGGDSGNRVAYFDVTLSAPYPPTGNPTTDAANTVTVRYRTFDQSGHGAPTLAFARAHGDVYLNRGGILRFTPGHVAQTVAVSIVPQTGLAFNPTFGLNANALANAINQNIANPPSLFGTATILTDGGTGLRVGVGDQSVTEGNTTPRTLHVAVALSEPAPTRLVVTAHTVPCTGGRCAVANIDYVPRTARLTFGVGQRSADFRVTLLPNTTPQADKTFQVAITAAATIVSPTATITIHDDDFSTTSITITPEQDPTTVGALVGYRIHVTSPDQRAQGEVLLVDQNSGSADDQPLGRDGNIEMFLYAGPAGTDTISLDFVGNLIDSNVDMTFDETVDPAASRTFIEPSPYNKNGYTAGDSIIFSAAVIVPVANATVAAPITFYDGSTPLATLPFNTPYTTSELAPGTHQITATYAGNVNYLPSTSDTLTVIINPKPN